VLAVRAILPYIADMRWNGSGARISEVKALIPLTLALAAFNAQAVEVFDWSGTCNQECFWQYAETARGLDYEIVTVGYRYDWPTELPGAGKPPTTPPVPEPAAWAMTLAGLVFLGASQLLRRRV
jgi:hypothetical protein